MKQIYKVLLLSFLLVSGFCFQLQSANSTWTPTETISMKVGEYVTRSLPLYYYTYTWRSSGSEVAINSYDISNHTSPIPGQKDEQTEVTIYAVKPGICYVTGTAFNFGQNTQYKRIYKVIITDNYPTSMVMQHQLHLGIGQTHTLSPRLLPSGTSSTLTWYSSNTNVATVSGGKITAVAVGDATITCITENGLREDCEVTVTPTMVSNLSLNQDQLQMSVGDTYQFSTAIAPENATYKQVTWTSMNPDVVSVDNNGLMSCLSNGWSVILATTVDGSNLTAGCFVQVGASEGGDVNGDGVISIKDVTDLIDRLLRG